jgi:hypothetical protein
VSSLEKVECDYCGEKFYFSVFDSAGIFSRLSQYGWELEWCDGRKHDINSHNNFSEYKHIFNKKHKEDSIILMCDGCVILKQRKEKIKRIVLNEKLLR